LLPLVREQKNEGENRVDYFIRFYKNITETTSKMGKDRKPDFRISEVV